MTTIPTTDTNTTVPAAAAAAAFDDSAGPADPVDEATRAASLVDAYLAAFSAPDDDERANLVTRAWAPDGHFADPLFAATGHDELIALAASVPELYPGHRFARTSGIDLHHDHARYTWVFEAADGTPVIEGVDVAQIGAADRLVRVIGFFGPVPPA